MLLIGYKLLFFPAILKSARFLANFFASKEVEYKYKKSLREIFSKALYLLLLYVRNIRKLADFAVDGTQVA